MGVRFRRRRGGGIQATLDNDEAAVLIALCRELTGLLPEAGEVPDPADPVLTRLFPRAYLDPTEEEADAEWRRFAQPDLVEGRREAVETVLHTLASARRHRNSLEVSLSDEEAGAWLGVINDARLALGTRLEVTEDTHPDKFRPGDPAAAPFAVYWWLGYLEETLVDTLASGING